MIKTENWPDSRLVIEFMNLNEVKGRLSSYKYSGIDISIEDDIDDLKMEILKRMMKK